MQRNPMQQGQRNPRHDAERDAAKQIDGQSAADDGDDELQKPESVPSLLTAREFQGLAPWVPGEGRKDDAGGSGGAAGERHAAASSSGSRGEPPITDDEPPRGKRGLPGNQTDDLMKGRKGPR